MFGNNEQPTLIKNGLIPHWSLSVRLDILLFGSIDADHDYAEVKIDNVSYGKFTKDYTNGIKICSSSSSGYYDDLILFNKNISHT